jgi:hypothetical protein
MQLRLSTARAVAVTGGTAVVAAVAAATTLTAVRCAAGGPSGEHSRVRVLVTGFNDWRDLAGGGGGLTVPPNLWRCRDNPSCRLLLGAPSQSPPLSRAGELCRLLRSLFPEQEAARAQVEWCFQTLPVTWQTGAGLDPHSFDVVIHIGLGVYDCDNLLLLEQGAFNGRAGLDALGHPPPGTTMEVGAGQQLLVPSMQASVAAMDGAPLQLRRSQHGGGGHVSSGGGGGGGPAPPAPPFTVRVAAARQANSYICNDTHYRSLRALASAEQRRSQGQRETGESLRADDTRLRAVYFIHIPRPALAGASASSSSAVPLSQRAREAWENKGEDLAAATDHGPLAEAVAALIEALLLQQLPELAAGRD